MKNSTSLRFAALAAALVLCSGATLFAQAAKPTIDGTWTWSTPGRNGGPDRVSTLTLKTDDTKLTGKLSAPGRGGQANETDITDGKVDGDAISFALVRQFNGNSNTNKYSGKLDGDKITGKIEFTRNGEAQSRDWEAKRAASTPAAP